MQIIKRANDKHSANPQQERVFTLWSQSKYAIKVKKVSKISQQLQKQSETIKSMHRTNIPLLDNVCLIFNILYDKIKQNQKPKIA